MRLRRLKSQKGVAMMTLALLLPVFAIFLVFAVDIGLASAAKSRIEMTVNQASDVAVMRLPDEAAARDVAISAVELGLLDAGRFGRDVDIVVETSLDTITVTAALRANSFFGGLANRSFYTVSSQSTRQLR